MLENGDNGKEIHWVKDGQEALDFLYRKKPYEKAHFDIVILDYTLPGMNGVEVLRQIKKQELNVPVIVVSGQKNETIVAEAMKQGAQDYIVKSANYYDDLPRSIHSAPIIKSTNKRTKSLLIIRPPFFFRKILSQLKNGKAVEALPLYGCAVSPRLQKIIDPFGVKF